MFSRHFYSQDGEDILLQSYFHRINKKKGFYVDIGAFHPQVFSNTLLFYERGWNGINIDANPDSMKLFKKFRKRDINIEAGVSDKFDELEYYSFKGGMSCMNGFNKKLSEERINEGLLLKEIIKIKVFPINELLNKYIPAFCHIDFMSIDIEGLDKTILTSLDWEKYAPDFLLVEELDGEIDTVSFMNERGYSMIGMTMRTLLFGRNTILR